MKIILNTIIDIKMQPQPLQMPTFREQASSIVDSVLPNYDQFGLMSVNDYKVLQQEVVSSIEERILGKDGNNGKLPLKEAMNLFNKRMYVTALEDAQREVADGVITYAASLLGYSREHFSRGCKNTQYELR